MYVGLAEDTDLSTPPPQGCPPVPGPSLSPLEQCDPWTSERDSLLRLGVKDALLLRLAVQLGHVLYGFLKGP